MNPRILMLLLAAVATLLLSACRLQGHTDVEERAGPVSLEIVAADWTGWSRQQPAPTTRKVDVSPGDSFVVSAVGDDVRFTVSDVDDDGLTLESDQKLMRDGSGFDDLETEFELTDGESLSLETPTMDAGTKITFTIE